MKVSSSLTYECSSSRNKKGSTNKFTEYTSSVFSSFIFQNQFIIYSATKAKLTGKGSCSTTRKSAENCPSSA
ncbi:hypothetical protein Hanom_Chr07g00616111 [Helianthus anomalus]